MNLKQIIRAECACYFREGHRGVNDWCERKDRVCLIFAADFKRCRYFEEGVLPANPDGAAEYADMCGQEGSAPVVKKKVCRNCGDAFIPDHNRQVYCKAECSTVAHKTATKHRQRRKRHPSLV